MTDTTNNVNEGRRSFMRSGAVFFAFTLLPTAKALSQTVLADEGKAVVVSKGNEALAGSLKTNPMLDAWIKISPENEVTVFTGKVELGTGIRTALLQIAAEELNMDHTLIHFLTADTGLSPDEGLTAGSHTISDSGTALRHAASQVRSILLAAASHELRAPETSLVARDAVIRSVDGRTITYGRAAGYVTLHRRASVKSPTKKPEDFQLIGKSLRRVDIPAKVTGGAAYVHDMRMVGMLHARIITPSSYGSTLIEYDRSLERMPGVVRVVRNGNLLAVIAKGEWQAVQAQRAIARSCRWSTGRTLPKPESIHDEIVRLSTQKIEISGKPVAPPPGTTTIKATYKKPYLLHGSIGPSCSIAQFKDGKLTVWTHSQGVYPLREGLMELLSLKSDDIRCIHVEGAGCYGHNNADDAAAYAALVAREVPGSPVRVQWMREQEHAWDHFTPAMITNLSASVDKIGRIVRWEHALWSSSHNERIVNAGRFLPAPMLQKPFVPAPSTPMVQPEGGGDRNAIPLYAFPQTHVTNNFSQTMPLPTSAMRSLGAHMNIFSIESFMDELAEISGTDPVEFRLKHLADSRARDVIKLAAARFGWPRQKRARNHGFGFGFGQYKNLMAYMAIAVEVSVQPETGHVQLEHAEVAIDSGQIVNPDGIRNQIQGGVIQAASWTLYEALQYDQKGIRSFDWSTYPILRFTSAPQSVNVHLIDRPGAPFLGAAEASMGPTAGALANALFDACGHRIREMPLAGEKLRQALNSK